MKPEVYYEDAIFLKSNDETMTRAVLYGVTGHPVLGSERIVNTSLIVTPPDEDGTFETLNTIYKRKNDVRC